MIKRAFWILASIVLSTSSAHADSYSASILYPTIAPGEITVQPRQVISNGTVGYGPPSGSSTPSHALLWTPPTGAVTDLNPTELGDVSASQALGAFDNQQVGSFGGNTTSGFNHAVLWFGTADSAVDLNPAQLGAFASQAHATDGIHQVGYGAFGTPTSFTHHAILWTGSAASAVDLNPTTLGNPAGSVALGVGGGQVVGDYSSPTVPVHAILWTGTADSAIDLHPSDPNLEFSEATATNGTQQVGSARANGGSNQAFLWFGTAASAVTLNPTLLAGIDSSVAVATNGSRQAGYGYSEASNVDDDHALVWSGSADSAIDLHSLLPSSGAWNFSDAYSIDSSGNVFGIANGTFNGVTGNFAVEWSAVPEPSFLGLALVTTLFLLSRRAFQFSASDSR